MIFQKASPLHDGAVLVSGARIKSAGCILPLSRDEHLGSQYGTRHRAALGLTERSDALCVVISEERSEVSIAEGKTITTYRKKGDFRDALDRGLLRASPGQQGIPRRNYWCPEIKLASEAACAFHFNIALASHSRTSAI